MGSLTFLHTNDTHGHLTEETLPQLLETRKSVELYFDSGDCIKAGNLGVPLKQELVWGHLKQADCTASVPGNRESHVLASAFEAKMKGASHLILCANMHQQGADDPVPGSKIIERCDLKLGLLGVMVPMVTTRMKTQAASQYLWDQPIPVAVEVAAKLRQECDFVIALTHIGLTQDIALAESTDDIDLILGGHSHDVLEEPTVIGSTAICQTGSHARFYGLGEFEQGKGLTSWEVKPWRS